MTEAAILREPVVVTGLGLVTSLGSDRETTWRALQQGRSNVRRLTGLPGFGERGLLAATVDVPEAGSGRLKVLPLGLQATEEAIGDAALDVSACDPYRFGCSLSAHMGDMRPLLGDETSYDPPHPWFSQWLPNTACAEIARQVAALGPRFSHSTACASSLISVLRAVRSIRDGHCDVAICGGADAINPLFAAGFQQMRVLADHDDPHAACRPFDRDRTGFVLGEGAAVLVIESLRHAMRRGARIYAQIADGVMLAQAHHVTGLDAECDAVVELIRRALQQANVSGEELGYINAHGTGTEQNDLVELRGIRRALGAAADDVCISATKSMLGHLINAAGATELAVTLLAMRDGFAPPTINLDHPDEECTIDCVPWRGKTHRFQHALKLSLAFGGHLVAVGLTRWNDARNGYGYPPAREAAAA